MTAKWTWRVSNGMLALNNGTTWSGPQWRVQFYWPECVLNRREFRAMWRTTVRVVYSGAEVGVGFQLLGVGFGVARAPAGKVAEGQQGEAGR